MRTSISVQVTCSCKPFSRKTIIFIIQAQGASKTSLEKAWKAAELLQNDNDPPKCELIVAFPPRWTALRTYADHHSAALLSHSSYMKRTGKTFMFWSSRLKRFTNPEEFTCLTMTGMAGISYTGGYPLRFIYIAIQFIMLIYSSAKSYCVHEFEEPNSTSEIKSEKTLIFLRFVI